MKVEIVENELLRTFIGIRATNTFSNLGSSINNAFVQLNSRKNEIHNIKNPNLTYGITPPNYKGNPGEVDFYCCYEVETIANLPQGMVHIRILPRMYSLTHYVGPLSETVFAYDHTSKWLNENGFRYDDVEYYFEQYCEDYNNEIKVYCPVKPSNNIFTHSQNRTSM